MKHMTAEEFRAYSEAVARGEIPKKKPATTTPKPKAKPKPKARRVTPALLNSLERRIDQIEDRLAPKSWAAALSHIARRDGIGMAAAGLKAAKEFPELHPARRVK